VIVPRTLFAKLLILFLGFGALMAGVLIFMMRVSHERYHLEYDQMVNRNLAQQYVADNLLVPEPRLTVGNLANALHRITHINPNVDVYVLDARGDILGASATAGRIVRTRVDLEPISRFLSGGIAFPLLGDDPTDPRHRDAFSAARLAIPASTAAYLYVVLNRHDEGPGAGRLKTTYAIGEDAGVVLAATLLAVAGAILFLRILTRRLGVLQQDIEGFRDGRLAALPERQSNDVRGPDDEIERLRRLFVELTERIREQMQELHKTDELRRELLANVSHDLRTPLTTLQTHLETLSMKDDLSADVRRTYLGIALQQCRRLVRLVDQLLELAKLDAKQMTFSPEPFQLAELAQDVVLKFSRSPRRGVTLTFEPPTQRVPLVVGDIALIEQVFDNLLENALRHARAGGRVTVSLTPGSQAVRVAVHDTGSGIPEGERDRVFDRFYRGDKSRSSESGRAGLGLSIARGILELHGGFIDFVSGAAEGTTFFFVLPIAAAGSAGWELSREGPRQGTAVG
jgi:two-component system OmpR family sensor kinase